MTNAAHAISRLGSPVLVAARLALPLPAISILICGVDLSLPCCDLRQDQRKPNSFRLIGLDPRGCGVVNCDTRFVSQTEKVQALLVFLCPARLCSSHILDTVLFHLSASPECQALIAVQLP
jgi:hypothetical protein